MEKSNYKKIFWGSFWGIFAKIFDALIKLFTVPLLIGFYGKLDFGLIALAFSLNTYLRLSELGMNTGGIKYFSQWFAQNKIDKINGLSQSSVIFYGIIGLINGIIVLLIGQFGDSIFHLSNHQLEIFQWLCLILALSSFFNWLSFVFIQLLTAYEDFNWLKQTEIIQSILNLIAIGIAIYFKLSLPIYFAIFTLTNLSIFPLNLYRLKIIKIPISVLLKPKWNKEIFREVLLYSLSIFALSLFQYTSNYLRPILLGIFDTQGVDSIADFRILQSITQLIVAMGSIFMGVLLPISSKKLILGEKRIKETLLYDGTKYVSIFLAYIVSLIILNSKEILVIYVGESFTFLSIWLQIWSLTILIYLHNSPIASMVLASGKTKMLVFSSAIGTVISITFLIITANTLHIGAAVIGFLIYIIIQMSFYYGYYNKKVFQIDSLSLLFNSFLKPALITLIPVLFVSLISKYFMNNSSIQSLIIKTILYNLIYLPILFLFIINYKDVKLLFLKIRQ